MTLTPIERDAEGNIQPPDYRRGGGYGSDGPQTPEGDHDRDIIHDDLDPDDDEVVGDHLETPPQLSREDIKQKIMTKIDEALDTGSMMVAVYSVNGTDLNMWRMTENFLTKEFDGALDLLEGDLVREREALQAD